MEQLRNALTSILKSIHPDKLISDESVSRVHFQRQSDKTPFPYILYDFPGSFDNEGQEVFTLDVNVWDNLKDSTRIERLASAIWKELNHFRYLDDQIQFSVYRDNRLPVFDDSEPGLSRRTMTFQVRYFDRSELDA